MNYSDITTGYRLKVDGEGSLYIWDGSDTSSLISISDEYGGTPAYNWSYGNEGDDYYSTSSAMGVYRDTSNSSDIHYKVAIKKTNSYLISEYDDISDLYINSSETNTSWEILKVSLNGVIDYSGTIYTDSITPFEGDSKFNQDLNQDGNRTGIVLKDVRDTSPNGTTLEVERGGSTLFIIDGSTEIQINDTNIENSSNWEMDFINQLP